MTDTPADQQGQPGANRRHDEPQIEVRNDVLMPDVRTRAEDEGRDPEEVDPIADDEDTFRRDSLGGRSKLD